jgi:general secretion pathway protein A
MYQEYFGFREPPFTLTPNPEFLFLSRCHQEAYAHLLYAIESRAGFIELSGEVGTGKTTIIRTLLGQLSPDKYRSALIFNPTLSPLGLMQEINREFGLVFSGTESRELHQVLNEFLLRENSADRTVILVIDEAQNLTRDVLEQVRLISNLETTREKLIQIVLVGQPELRKLLARDDLRQLNQRITVRYHLDRMAAGEIHAYIRHRIRIAAQGKEPVTFSPGAVKRISTYSKGLPRLINSVCDRALLLAYTKDATAISASMIVSAIADLAKTEKRSSSAVILSVLLLLTIAAATALFLLNNRSAPQLPPQTAASVAATAEKTRFAADGVTNLQELLVRTGHYAGKITGRFDMPTEAAIRSFQQSEGLAIDGKPGGRTLMRLYQRTGGKFSIHSAAGVEARVK